MLVPLLLALLPLRGTSLGPQSVVRVSQLCGSEPLFGFSGSLVNPSTVAVELTEPFSLRIALNGTLVGEATIPAFVLAPGSTSLEWPTAQRWRVSNESHAARLIEALVNRSPGTTLTLSAALPVRVYGALAMNFPFSYDLDLGPAQAATAAPTTAPAAATSAPSVGLASLQVLQADASTVAVRAGLDVVGIAMVEAQVPALALEVTTPAQDVLGRVAIEPFALRGAVSSAAAVQVALSDAHLAQLQATVLAASTENAIRISVRGAAAASEPCMAQRVLVQARLAINVPTSSARSAVGRVSAPRAAAAPLLALRELRVGEFDDSTGFTTRVAAQLGFAFVGSFPNASFTLATATKRVVRLSVSGADAMVAARSELAVRVRATVEDLDEAAAVATQVVDSAPLDVAVTASGDGTDPMLLSRILSAWRYRAALRSSTPTPATTSSSPLAFGVDQLGVDRVDATSVSVTAAVRVQLASAPVLVTLPSTSITLSSSPAPGVAMASLTAEAASSQFRFALVVADVPALGATLQAALDNNTSAADVSMQGGAENSHVVNRLLRRMRFPLLRLATALNPAPPAPATPAASSFSLLRVALVSMTASAASVRVTFNVPSGLVVSGALPTVSVQLVHSGVRTVATVTGSCELPNTPPTLGCPFLVTVVASDAAASLREAINDASAVEIRARGAPAADTDNIVSRVLARLALVLKAAGPPAPGSAANSRLRVDALTLVGDKGTPATPVIEVAATVFGLDAPLFIGVIPALRVRVTNGATAPFAVIATPQLSFTGAPMPTSYAITATITRSPELATIVTSIFESRAVSLAVTGDQSGGNLLQSVLDALVYTSTIAPPSGAKVGGGGVLPAVRLSYVDSTADTLSLSVAYSFTSTAAFRIVAGFPTLAAEYEGETILVSAPTSGATLSVDPGVPTSVSVSLRVQADTPARRIKLESFATAAMAGTATPLRLRGLIPGVAPVPGISVVYDFSLPKNANGDKSAGGGVNELIPCIETGLTTPFDSTWSFGKCTPLTGCRCSSSNLCAVGRSSAECGTSTITSRCVDNTVSIIAHFYVKNPFPLNARLVSASADVHFDYAVAGLGSFSNTRNTTNVLLASMAAPAPGSALLNTLPLALNQGATQILTLWIRDSTLAPPPAAAFATGSSAPQPGASSVLTGILLKEAYAEASKVPLPLHIRNAALQLQLEQFNFRFVFSHSFVYASTSLVPDFITNSSKTCAWITGMRPPCWRRDGTVMPGCFVDQFEYPCIMAGSPSSACGTTLGPLYEAVLGAGRLGDVCCRDAVADGSFLPAISTLCYNTQQERTGTFTANRGSCPADLIEAGFSQRLISWRL